MNKTILIVTLALSQLIGSTYSQTRSTIADGNFMSPTTWDCSCIPLPTEAINITHNVTLNYSYAFTNALSIGSTGSLNTTGYGVAISNATFTNNGTLISDTIYINQGTNTTSGTTTCNLFYLEAATTYSNSGTLTVVDSLGILGNFSNSGNVNARVLLNSGVFTNTNSHTGEFIYTATDFTNSGHIAIDSSFFNSQSAVNSGIIEVGYDFLTGDTVSTAYFTNNGNVYVANNFLNSMSVNGMGNFCVQMDTYNSGNMTGTFDFCDQSGGGIDFNSGTVAGTITYCTKSCNIGIEENEDELVAVYPNPVKDELTVVSKSKGMLTVYTVDGAVLFTSNISGQTQIDVSGWTNGVYIVKVTNQNGVTTKQLIK